MSETTNKRIDRLIAKVKGNQEKLRECWKELLLIVKANARLIAARPDLLEACKMLVSRDGYRCCPFCSKSDWGKEKHGIDCPFALAYAAIAKAKELE